MSETGALLIMQRGNWSPGKVLPPRLLGVGQTRYYFTTGRVLAHCHKWLPGLESHQHSRLQRALSYDWTTRQENWWPARVTRPVPRIKSPLHHFNACRPKLVLAAGFAPALATFSTSCLCVGLRELLAQCHKMEPPASAAPAGFLYKRNPQAAAWRHVPVVAGMLMPRSPQCCPGPGWLMTPA